MNRLILFLAQLISVIARFMGAPHGICYSRRKMSPPRSLISIIIPVINEEAALATLLQQLQRERTAHEVIVVDGGSTDRSVELVRSSEAVVIYSRRGRGNQICRGVEQASGDILLFLHADSVFPSGGLQRIREVLAALMRWAEIFD